MAIETIIARIESDAEEEAQRIREETKQEIGRILSEAGKTAEERHSGIIARGEQEIKTITGRILSQARMDARHMLREAKERGISDCFSEAEKSLTHITQTTRYETILRDLIRDAIDELGAEDAVIISTERDREIVRKILPETGKKISIGTECAIAIGGVIVRSRSGSVTVNNTFDVRLERQRDGLVYELSRILYESG